MDPIVGSLPDSAGAVVSAAVERFLQSEYGIAPKDFVSAELKLVPEPIGTLLNRKHPWAFRAELELRPSWRRSSDNRGDDAAHEKE